MRSQFIKDILECKEEIKKKKQVEPKGRRAEPRDSTGTEDWEDNAHTPFVPPPPVFSFLLSSLPELLCKQGHTGDWLLGTWSLSLGPHSIFSGKGPVAPLRSSGAEFLLSRWRLPAVTEEDQLSSGHCELPTQP